LRGEREIEIRKTKKKVFVPFPVFLHRQQDPARHEWLLPINILPVCVYI
jgi:hypothetical protein